MEVIKKIVFIFIVVLVGCKQPSNTKDIKNNVKKEINKDEIINKKDIIKVPKSIITENLLNCFTKENEVKHIEDETLFVYKEFSLELTNDDYGQYLVYKKNKNADTYPLINDNYDQADFDIKIYKSKNDYIFLLETIDYYSSVIYIYIYVDGVLTRLGDISIDQPNVEDEGIKKESFKICKENDTILMECFLDKKLYSTHKFKIDKSKVIKKSEGN